ncbi:MAG: hypothetical protein ACFBSG_01900 [Leptolyngbyaceae cyanobacterium]
MLSTLFSPLWESDATFGVDPNFEFFDNTSLLDLVTDISPVAATFLLDEVVAPLETATGELTIEAGVIEGTLAISDDESLSFSLDGPALLSEAGTLLETATGALTLADGIVDATLTLDTEIYEVNQFDLATFAAEGLGFLITAIDTSIPIVDGAFLIDIDTALGDVTGSIDVAGGSLDLDLVTPAGEIDFSVPFSPEAQYEFAIPLFGASIDATVNLFTGNIEVPVFGMDIAVPLESLSGELGLDEGIATLTLDSDFGPIATSFDVAELVDDWVIDTLTGLTVDAALLSGQLDVFATSPTDDFAATVDVLSLADQAIATLSQTDGALTLADESISGVITVEDTPLDIEGAINLADLLNTSLSNLLALSVATV